MSISLITSTALGYVYVPAVDPRISTHIDILKTVNGNGPAAPVNQEPTVVTPEPNSSGQSNQ